MCLPEHRAEGIVTQLNAVLADIARAIEEREYIRHPLRRAYGSHAPHVMRLGEIAVVQFANSATGTVEALAHGFGCLAPGLGACRSDRIAGLLAKHLPCEV